MKTLFYRRHSKKDGPADTIGSGGIAMAELAGAQPQMQITESESTLGLGREETKIKITFARIFHGLLVRTAQTALAFCRGLGYTPHVMPVVMEIGSQELFNEMATPEFRAAVKAGRTNFDALFDVHPLEKIQMWAQQALAAVKMMFDHMEDGEAAVAFGHSPMIELALWQALNEMGLPTEYVKLGDLEGVKIQLDGEGIYLIGEKIPFKASLQL